MFYEPSSDVFLGWSADCLFPKNKQCNVVLTIFRKIRDVRFCERDPCSNYKSASVFFQYLEFRFNKLSLKRICHNQLINAYLSKIVQLPERDSSLFKV